MKSAPYFCFVEAMAWEWRTRSWRSDHDCKPEDSDSSRRCCERRSFADAISSMLQDVKAQQAQDSFAAGQIVQQMSMLQLSVNQIFGVLGELKSSLHHQSYTQPHVGGLPVAELHRKHIEIEIPSFSYVTKFVEVPQVHVVDKNLEALWEKMERRSMNMEDELANRMEEAAQQKRLENEQASRVEGDGEWEPVDGMVVGDIVRVAKEIQTDDNPLSVILPVDSLGEVIFIDGDGDAQVRFPKLVGLKSIFRWVVRRKFQKLDGA